MPRRRADILARPLARPLHLFISYDEEVDCGGAKRLIEDLAVSGLRPDMCVVGEPSGMKPILAHKGKFDLTVRCAVWQAIPASHRRASTPSRPPARRWPGSPARPVDWRPKARSSPALKPPHTTIHAGTVEGGTILNIIPQHAAFTMEWRPIPGDAPRQHVERLRGWIGETIEPAMKAVDPACGFAFDVALEMPGMALAADHPLATVVKQITGCDTAGKVAYGTEGGFFESAGIPTIICGPGHIAQAHQPDEWIAESELGACDSFIRRLADALLV